MGFFSWLFGNPVQGEVSNQFKINTQDTSQLYDNISALGTNVLNNAQNQFNQLSNNAYGDFNNINSYLNSALGGVSSNLANSYAGLGNQMKADTQTLNSLGAVDNSGYESYQKPVFASINLDTNLKPSEPKPEGAVR
ncbi:MAG: hypothetical protein QXL94_02875 [Candidatus Parvarchaeum sp.]